MGTANNSNASILSPLRLALLTLTLGVSNVPAIAQSVADIVSTCSGCHLKDGVTSDSQIPIIWGQHPGYIYIQLRDFDSGARKTKVDESMHAVASSMTDEQRREVAEFVSKQPWPKVKIKEAASAELLENGRELSVSAGCGGCHANNFGGFFSSPRLAGQSRAYLVTTLQQYASYERKNAPGMANFASTLPPDRLNALAAYLESIEPTTPFSTPGLMVKAP